MCGRIIVTLEPSEYRALFDYPEKPNFPPRYNVAPTQPVPVVTSGFEGRHFRLVRWGFLPGWLKDPAGFPLLINARSETAAEKATFRGAMRHRRCIFLADGFYEWRRSAGAGKEPFLVRLAEGGPMPLAGLWETWSGADGSEIDTAAIVTTSANGTLAAIHERMPVILEREGIARWLDHGSVSADAAASLCRPSDRPLDVTPVSPRVNSVKHDDAGLTEPTAPAQRAPTRSPPPADDGAQGSLL